MADFNVRNTVVSKKIISERILTFFCQGVAGISDCGLSLDIYNALDRRVYGLVEYFAGCFTYGSGL